MPQGGWDELHLGVCELHCGLRTLRAFASVRRMKKKALPLWSILALCWAAYAVVYAEQLLSWSSSAGQAMTRSQALLISAGSWLVWVPYSLLLIQLVRFRPIGHERLGASLLALSFGTAFVVLSKVLLVLWLNPAIGWYPQLPPLAEIVQASIRNNLPVCVFVIGVAHALLFAERARHRELRIAELQAHLSQARLETLSTQLNPHFLFNTLNSIAELVHHDAEASDRMLVGLSALLRRSLDRSHAQEVRLSDELELLAHYLDIQKIRLGSRLRIAQTIDPTALDARVPALILQPIAENAIVHAIARRIEGGELRIYARREHARLILEIVNDGDARIAGDMETNHDTGGASAGGARPRAGANPGTGVGLRNTRERLACLYGHASRLELLHDDDGTTRARIELPYSRHTGAASIARAAGAMP